MEEDPELRKNVNVYKDPRKLAVDEMDSDNDETPKITLAEMLDEMSLDQAAAAADQDEGDEMQE